MCAFALILLNFGDLPDDTASRLLPARLLLLLLLQGPYGVPAVLSGTDLVAFTWQAMENETDPRCLLHGLKCVQVSSSNSSWRDSALGHNHPLPEHTLEGPPLV